MTDFANAHRFKISTGLAQKKSAIMVYGDPDAGSKEGFVFGICGDHLPLVRTYTYLGVRFQHMGSWDNHLSMIASRVAFRLADLRKAGLGRDGLPPLRCRSLVWAEFCPVWEYACGSIMYTSQQVSKLESMFNKVVREAAGVRAFVSIGPILRDMDLLEARPTERIYMYRLTLWRKILGMNQNRWVRRAVQMWDAHVHFAWQHELQLRAVHFSEIHRCRALNLCGPHPNVPKWPISQTTWMTVVKDDMFRLFKGSDDVTKSTAAEWKGRVKEALFMTCTQPRWRKELDKRPFLSVYSAETPSVFYEVKEYRLQVDGVTKIVRVRKKQKTFCRFLKSEHRRKRQFHLTLRAGSLPLRGARDHVRYFGCGGKDQPGDTTCFMCRQGAKETIQHFMNECPGYEAVKDAFKWWREDMDLSKIFRSPGQYGSHVHLLFLMWSSRIQCWRRQLRKGERVPFI